MNQWITKVEQSFLQEKIEMQEHRYQKYINLDVNRIEKLW